MAAETLIQSRDSARQLCAVGRSFVEHVVHRHHFETRASCPSEEDPRRFLLTSQRGI